MDAILAFMGFTVVSSMSVFAATVTKRSQKKSELKLLYFDIPGKGEAIRLVCAYASLDLEDARVDREKFLAMKYAGQLPFGQLPVLEVNGGETKLAQSGAIMRYIGKLSGLYPNCPIKAAKVDAIIDQQNDMCAGLSVSRYTARFGFGILDTNREMTLLIRKDLNDTILPQHLTLLEKLVHQSSTGWIADTPEPSIADFVLVPCLQWLASGANDGISTDILSKFPALQALIQKLLSLAAIKQYYAAKAVSK